ncbi:hypothetical protein [Pseudomonas tolaasii]|nr:hypothetical protein [Pseudomonas tolaasii]
MTIGEGLVVFGALTQLAIIGWLTFPFVHPIVKAHIAGSKVKYGP